MFSEAEFEHWFLPRAGVISTYVVRNGSAITDMISFYTLPSTVVNNPTVDVIVAAYVAVASNNDKKKNHQKNAKP